jgi:hypothetical protein
MKVLAAIFVLAFVVVIAQTNLLPVTAAQVQNPAPAPADVGPEQPIPFSHQIHAGTVKLACDTCHGLSKSGDSFAIPQATFCMQCHQTIAADKPAIQKLAGYAKSGQAIPWVRVYEVPSFVTFSHKTHLDHGNTCQECHGPVAERTQLSKETDISMAGCLACHRTKQAATGCDTCHTLEQVSLDEHYLQGASREGMNFERGKFSSSQQIPFWKVPVL